MKAFRRILVYASIDDAANVALKQGAALARIHGASLHVLRVLTDEGRLARWLGGGEDADRMRRDLEQLERELFEEQLAPLRAEGIQAEFEVRWGSPWQQVIQAVIEGGHELVLKTAEGAARGRGLLFGSTAMHLIRKCPCPVWLLKEPPSDRRLRILAALDPEPDGVRPATAQSVLTLAQQVAGPRGEFHVVSVWRAAAETLLRGRTPPADFDAHVQSERERAAAALQTLLAETPIDADRVHLVHGNETEVLPRMMVTRRFDLIVLANRGRTAMSGLLIGETAETLVRSVDSSVLVVKPPDFRSPLQKAKENAPGSMAKGASD